MMRRARVVVVVLLAGCKADLPVLPDANGTFDARCVGPYADFLVDAFPTSLPNASAVLGAPDMNAATLAADNVVTVGFIGLGGVSDANGSDLKIHATVDSGGLARVFIAQSEMMFRHAGDVSATSTEIDLQQADFSTAIYARIIGVSGMFHVDAVQATHDMCR